MGAHRPRAVPPDRPAFLQGHQPHLEAGVLLSPGPKPHGAQRGLLVRARVCAGASSTACSAFCCQEARLTGCPAALTRSSSPAPPPAPVRWWVPQAPGHAAVGPGAQPLQRGYCVAKADSGLCAAGPAPVPRSTAAVLSLTQVWGSSGCQECGHSPCPLSLHEAACWPEWQPADRRG